MRTADDRYTYLTTWLGEHQNESDMAFYSTDPVREHRRSGHRARRVRRVSDDAAAAAHDRRLVGSGLRFRGDETGAAAAGRPSITRSSGTWSMWPRSRRGRFSARSRRDGPKDRLHPDRPVIADEAEEDPRGARAGRLRAGATSRKITSGEGALVFACPLEPGSGTGYFPSGPSRSGAGPSSVSLSTSGANSCSLFSIWSKVTSWPVWAAMRPIDATMLASAPRFTSLYGLSSRMAAMRSSHSQS